MGVPKRNWWLWLRRKLFVLSPRQLVWIHAILQMLDWATTAWVVDYVGLEAEGNPIVRYILSYPEYGFHLFFLVKAAMCVAIAYCLPKHVREYPTYAWVWRLLAIIYFAVVLSNLLGVAILHTVL